jgi:hypothetical protein
MTSSRSPLFSPAIYNRRLERIEHMQRIKKEEVKW